MVLWTRQGLAEKRVNLKPNLSLSCEVWGEDLLCAASPSLQSSPLLHLHCHSKGLESKKSNRWQILPTALRFGVWVCWRDHDLTSCSTPSDMLLGVPAVLTLKELSWEAPHWQMQQSPPIPHPINHYRCGIIVKQARSLLSAPTHRKKMIVGLRNDRWTWFFS